MNTIFLVRHAENLANLTKEFSYQKVDYALTPKGVLQARQTAEFFRDQALDHLYCSPLRRARQTAEIIGAALGLQPMEIEAFREVNVGDLEGVPPTQDVWEAHDQVIAAWKAGQLDVSMPGGEDYHSVWARFQDGLRQMCAGKTGQRMAVVGHGGMFSFCLQDLCPDVDALALRRGPNQNCSISEIRLAECNGRVRADLVSWCRLEHLSGPAAQFVLGFTTPQDFDPSGRLIR